MQLNENLKGVSIVQGKYSVSIPTSLAFEMLFGIHDEIEAPTPLPYTYYKYLTINVRTLLRNIFGSVDKELKTKWTAEHYYKELLAEIDKIPEIISNQSDGKLQVYFYLSGYYRLEKEYKKNVIKYPNPAKPNLYDSLEKEITLRLMREVRNNHLPILLSDMEPMVDPDDRYNTMIMTHLPIDLVPFRGRKNVYLLESHTAVIKDYKQWYTKLNLKSEYVPFGKFSIQALGDGKTFTGAPPKYRKALIEFAKSKHWNQLTSDHTIRLQFSSFPDKKMRDELRELF